MTNTQTFDITGMTCGHCVAAVTAELTQLAGVRQVDVDLVAGGISTVYVVSSTPLGESEVRVAVDEAGYELVGAGR
jgi:copper chaperone CopZ